eukprot:SAG31_NODE_34443_length_333_cov_0.427350_1_plen_30_part_10
MQSIKLDDGSDRTLSKTAKYLEAKGGRWAA